MDAAQRRNGEPVWLELTTTGPDESVAFYSDLFGWTPDPAPGRDGGVTVRLGGARVARIVPGPTDGWVVYLRTDDAVAASTAVAAHGGRIEVAPTALDDLALLTVAVDPSGARVGFWEPERHPGFGIVDTPGAPCWFELHTADFAAAVPFYERVAAWRPVWLGDSDGFRMVANGAPGEAEAGIFDAARDDLTEASTWMPYFAVDDADESAARIRELGGSLLDEIVDTPFGRLVHATDPLGTLFTIIRLPERTP
jgi:Predicted enzyme related to lactoylglutathione lyase